MSTTSNRILWVTEVKALSPIDGQMRTYCGPEIEAGSLVGAREYCELNGLGYCWVVGQLVCEIPCLDGTLEPDFDNKVDYKEVENSDDGISDFFT